MISHSDYLVLIDASLFHRFLEHSVPSELKAPIPLHSNFCPSKRSYTFRSSIMNDGVLSLLLFTGSR